MAAGIGEHVQDVAWSVFVKEVFYPRSRDGETGTVLAGEILSGEQDQPIGLPVLVKVGDREVGSGTIISRYRFEGAPGASAAYTYEGSSIDRADLSRGIVVKQERSKG